MPRFPDPRRVPRFPDPRRAPPDAPLAVGAALDPDTLVAAYRQGIFPWPAADGRIYWWSPDPRAVLELDALHVSRSLARALRRGHLAWSADAAFADVVAGCADRPGEGTWITPAMAVAYARLHRLGVAHSVEVWERASGRLAGGVYGVALGTAFMGESMFHRVRDASKVALYHLVACLRERGFTLFDVQLPTPHLASLGAVAVDRDTFLDRLAVAVAAPPAWP